MEKFLPIVWFTLFFLLFDGYAWQAIRSLNLQTPAVRIAVSVAYWGFSLFCLVSFASFRLLGQAQMNRTILLISFLVFFVFYIAKLVLVLFMLGEDISRGLSLAFQWSKKALGYDLAPHSPARSAALAKIALSVAAVPFFSFLYGIVKGGHKYQVRSVPLPLKNLPDAFHGLKIVQISDVHSGSFYDAEAVSRGIDLILAQKPDVVFFTGDLVNNEASELEPWLDQFSRIKAPMGVFSILGNHDYGHYKPWNSLEEKEQNFRTLFEYQRKMGWRLLVDEHVALRKGEEEIAVVGVQNWSAKGNFPRIGNLKKALHGAEHFPVRLLLSHDPSHWDAEVLPDFPEVDAMFAGHTHGMQFGVEIPGFRWSPVQYVYKKWAGLYSEGHRHLYVNRGFGFIAYPGRVGIWPEITVFTLGKA